jgi:putative flippase GtrA
METLFLVKFLKFCVVGLSGTVIDFGITWLLKEKIRLNKYLANTCGFVLAATSNYFWNRIWTFGSNNPQVAREYLLFFLFAAIGLGLKNLILWFFADRTKLNFYLSKAIAIALVTLWNFSMNFFFTFLK